jgi:hypothetical protein
VSVRELDRSAGSRFRLVVVAADRRHEGEHEQRQGRKVLRSDLAGELDCLERGAAGAIETLRKHVQEAERAEPDHEDPDRPPRSRERGGALEQRRGARVVPEPERRRPRPGGVARIVRRGCPRHDALERSDRLGDLPGADRT